MEGIQYSLGGQHAPGSSEVHLAAVLLHLVEAGAFSVGGRHLRPKLIGLVHSFNYHVELDAARRGQLLDFVGLFRDPLDIATSQVVVSMAVVYLVTGSPIFVLTWFVGLQFAVSQSTTCICR